MENRTKERMPSVWEPVENVERRFEDFMRSSLTPAFRRWMPREPSWTPAMDLTERNDKYIVTMELPGIKIEDIDVSVSDGSLTVKGEKKTEKEIKEESYYSSERSYGSFYRSVPLPRGVDAGKIKAAYDNGILEIDIPKTSESQPSRINIAVKRAPTGQNRKTSEMTTDETEEESERSNPSSSRTSHEGRKRE